MRLVGRLTPPTTPADRLAALPHAQRHLHALGITAWQDALVGEFLGMDNPSEGRIRRRRGTARSPRASSGAVVGTASVAPSRSLNWPSGGPRCVTAASTRGPSS